MNYKHGLMNSPIYTIWVNMKQRCYNFKSTTYEYYGARGITVCDRWLNSFENFYNDMISTYVKGLQLDRIDNNGNYEPDNCRWATRSQNTKNRRTRVINAAYFSRRNNKWRIVLEFDTKEEAEKTLNKIKL